MSHGQQELRTHRADTRSIGISAAPGDVFAFVADPSNLPQWAVGFCRSIRRGQDDRWLVTTASGEIPIRFESDPTAGTIDFFFSVAPGLEAAAFSRVVPNGDGAEYIFTQFQIDGMPSEVFEAQVQALIGEMQVLRGVIHARSACRPMLVQEER